MSEEPNPTTLPSDFSAQKAIEDFFNNLHLIDGVDAETAESIQSLRLANKLTNAEILSVLKQNREKEVHGD